MPFNLSGTLAGFHALLRPRIILPSLSVQDIRYLNFTAFKEAGYKGVILDKDNCLTYPRHDTIIPDLEVAWEEMKLEFGPSNLLIVSNSAGTHFDSAGLAAESVSNNLGTPVLRHPDLKPSYKTISAIRRYFASLPSPITEGKQLLVIGDRVMTDIVLANRLGAYGILVQKDWTHTFKAFTVGWAEKTVVKLVRRWIKTLGPSQSHEKFIRLPRLLSEEIKLNYAGSTWTWFGRALGMGQNTGKHG